MIFQPNIIAHVVEAVDQGRFVDPLPHAYHFIEGQHFPLVTTRNSSVYLAHYLNDTEPFSGPVKRLTFLQLGSCEAPNLAPFANTCTQIEIKGHINNVHTLFSVMRQLPKLTKVDISINSSQQYFCQESYKDFMSKTPLCPSVKKFKLTMDLDYFHSFHNYDCSSSDPNLCNANGICFSPRQFSLLCLVESILKHAGDSCVNLKTLNVDLPENDRICASVESLIQTCPGLRSKTQTMSVQNIPPKNNASSRKESVTPFHPRGSHVRPDSLKIRPSHFEATISNSLPRKQFPGHFSQHHQNSYPSNNDVLAALSPQLISTPVTYRPPPGFPPMTSTSSDQSELETRVLAMVQTNSAQQDVHQRVYSWLRTLQN